MHRVDKRLARNDATMANTLPTAAEPWRWGCCIQHGVHGAAKARRGVKRGTSATRRRVERQQLQDALDAYFEST